MVVITSYSIHYTKLYDGYALGPQHLIQGLVRIHQYTVMSSPTIAQIAAVEALEDRDEAVGMMVEEYDRRRSYNFV